MMALSLNSWLRPLDLDLTIGLSFVITPLLAFNNHSH